MQMFVSWCFEPVNTEFSSVSLWGTIPKISTFKICWDSTSTIRTPFSRPWIKSIKSDKNNLRKIKSIRKSWETCLKNMMTKTTVNRPSRILKKNSSKWKINTKKINQKTKPRVYQRWNSCKWPKKNKSKKISMMPTSSSINSKMKILKKLQLTAMTMISLKMQKTERKAPITTIMKIKSPEKYMVRKNLKMKPKIQPFSRAKNNLSRKTSIKHFFWAIILTNSQRALTFKTWKISTSHKELILNSIKSSFKWTEIFLTTMTLKMRLY